ncbi:uroporphyrinogen-III synthase [Chryseomicrobium sp. FSL W7-1435]|uniref:uroporphyrinogen-III synthase n=1 Tax=Chryseomicrobium sp. FSL W7-1435 TaxID=2921704 RepID=UPI00315A86FC
MSKAEPFILTSQLHDEELITTIKNAGFQPVHLPLIETQPVVLTEAELAQVMACDWLLFTSQTAVHAFFQQTNQAVQAKFAVVGSKTERALTTYGYTASFKPSIFSADVFVKEWNEQQTPNQHVAFLKGNLAKATIETGLAAQVTSYVIYETVALTQNVSEIEQLCQTMAKTTVVFASPSAVHTYSQGQGKVLNSTIYCAIGHITKKAMQDNGFPVHVMPSRYTFEDLLTERIQYKE